MPHIHTGKNEIDFTVDAFIVRIDNDVPKILLHMHRKLNRLLPVGGHIELTENPWQALIREIKEESGYEIGQLKLLQPKYRIKKLSGAVLIPYPLLTNTHKIADDHYHTAIEYAFITNSEPNLEIDESESSDMRWLSEDEIMAMPDDLIFTNIKEICNFIFNETLPNWAEVSVKEFSND